jgi:hypothetical protein
LALIGGLGVAAVGALMTGDSVKSFRIADAVMIDEERVFGIVISRTEESHMLPFEVRSSLVGPTEVEFRQVTRWTRPIELEFGFSGRSCQASQLRTESNMLRFLLMASNADQAEARAVWDELIARYQRGEESIEWLEKRFEGRWRAE